MVMRRSFAQRIGYVWTCVAPATLLSDEASHDEPQSLREVASTDGLCYVQVLRPLTEGCYLTHVAASPDRLHTHAYTLVLSEEELRLALAYDCRIMGKHPQQALAMLHAHAQALAPLARVVPDETPPAPPVSISPVPASPSAAVAVSAAFVLTPVSLPEPLVLSTAELHEILQSAQPSGPSASPDTTKHTAIPSLSSFGVQQALLGVAIDTLMDRLFTMEQGAQALVLQARCTILASLQRWHRHTQQRVVTLVPCYEDAQRQPLWHLLIEGPVRLHVAAAEGTRKTIPHSQRRIV